MKHHRNLELKIYTVNQIVRAQVDKWVSKKSSDVKSYLFKQVRCCYHLNDNTEKWIVAILGKEIRDYVTAACRVHGGDTSKVSYETTAGSTTGDTGSVGVVGMFLAQFFPCCGSVAQYLSDG